MRQECSKHTHSHTFLVAMFRRVSGFATQQKKTKKKKRRNNTNKKKFVWIFLGLSVGPFDLGRVIKDNVKYLCCQFHNMSQYFARKYWNGKQKREERQTEKTLRKKSINNTQKLSLSYVLNTVTVVAVVAPFFFGCIFRMLCYMWIWCMASRDRVSTWRWRAVMWKTKRFTVKIHIYDKWLCWLRRKENAFVAFLFCFFIIIFVICVYFFFLSRLMIAFAFWFCCNKSKWLFYKILNYHGDLILSTLQPISIHWFCGRTRAKKKYI